MREYDFLLLRSGHKLPGNHGLFAKVESRSLSVARPPQKQTLVQTKVMEKTLEIPLAYKETKPVNPKGNQPLIFIERTDAEAPILWTPDVETQFNGKDPDAGKD